MKKLIALVVLVLALGSQATAQMTKLSLRASSNIPIRVIVDGNFTSQKMSLVNLNHLSAGNHQLEVFYTIQDYFGIKEELLFSGTVYLPLHTKTEAFINENHQFIIDNQFALNTPPPNPYGNYYGYVPPCTYCPSTPVVCPPQPPVCSPPPAQVIVPEPVLHPIEDGAFAHLKNSIKKQAFSDNKMRVFRQALKTNYFTSVQVNELINLFTFSQDRLKVAKKAYTKTLDQDNYFVVYDSLQWSSSVSQLSNYIASL